MVERKSPAVRPVILEVTATDAQILRVGHRVGYPLVVAPVRPRPSVAPARVEAGTGAARDLLDAVYALRRQGSAAQLAPAAPAV